MNNKLIIAAAGSGKTTFLVKQALEQDSGNVLITTFTEANEVEIKKKIIELKKCVPSHITVQTWFSFLLQHGVKPFQGGVFQGTIKGLLLVNEQSGLKYTTKQGRKIYHGENESLRNFYLSKTTKIYSDKLAKFVIRCNEASSGDVIKRITRIYSHIFIDEVQDLAGYDLELLLLLFNSTSEILLVGDPRQVTYLTHHEKKHSSYQNGLIKDFIKDKCKKASIEIDENSLSYSHRNNAEICSFSSMLYPQYPASQPCECIECRNTEIAHNGIFIVREHDIQAYLEWYNPTILRYQKAGKDEWNYGMSKGLGFERTLIYPTKGILQYLIDGQLTRKKKGKTEPAFDIAKFYVALTRARYSAAIVCNFTETKFIEGVQKWKPEHT